MSPCDSPLPFHTFLPIVLLLTPAAGIQDMPEGANTVAAERALRVGLPVRVRVRVRARCHFTQYRLNRSPPLASGNSR